MKELNFTQQFFVDAFEKDLSDKDLKEIKLILKKYFAQKLEQNLDDLDI